MYVYIIQSSQSNRYYIGSTADVTKRLKQHNSGSNRSTKAHRPWKLVHVEVLATKAEALVREKQIKSYKGGRAFKSIVEQSNNRGGVA